MSQNCLLKNFKAVNFRNLSEDIFEFSTGINCVFGKNGQGKTNILEAVYLLCTGKSFRKKATFPQLLSIDSVNPEIILSSTITQANQDYPLSLKITKERCQSYFNNSLSKKKKKIPATFIAPFDSFRFFNESDFKRYWFDNSISILNDAYGHRLKKYQKHIRNRNKLLAVKPARVKEQINAIDEVLSELIKSIIDDRLEYVDKIETLCTGTFNKIFSKQNDLQIKYASGLIGKTAEEIYHIYRQNYSKDLKFGFSTCGPHRDSFNLIFDGFDTQSFCSIGQQKMAFISLVFAYIELFRYKFNTYPLLLVDDVSGELDKDRWQKLLTYFGRKEFQVLITTANKEFENEVLKLNDANQINIFSGGINC